MLGARSIPQTIELGKVKVECYVHGRRNLRSTTTMQVLFDIDVTLKVTAEGRTFRAIEFANRMRQNTKVLYTPDRLLTLADFRHNTFKTAARTVEETQFLISLAQVLKVLTRFELLRPAYLLNEIMEHTNKFKVMEEAHKVAVIRRGMPFDDEGFVWLAWLLHKILQYN